MAIAHENQQADVVSVDCSPQSNAVREESAGTCEEVVPVSLSKRRITMLSATSSLSSNGQRQRNKRRREDSLTEHDEDTHLPTPPDTVPSDSPGASHGDGTDNSGQQDPDFASPSSRLGDLDPLESFDTWALQPNDNPTARQTIDVAEDEATLSWHCLHNVKRAADFLLALGLGRAAFPLYVVLLKRLKAVSLASEWMQIWVCTALVRSAEDAAHDEVVRHELSQHDDNVAGQPERKLLSALLTRDKRKTKPVSRNDKRCVAVRGCLYEIMLESNTIQAIEPSIINCSPEALERWHIRTLFSPLNAHDSGISNSFIRRYLEWCVSALTDDMAAALQLYELSFNIAWRVSWASMRLHWLFGLLWQKYQMFTIVEHENLPEWATDLENRVGLSSSELMRVLINMLTDQFEFADFSLHDEDEFLPPNPNNVSSCSVAILRGKAETLLEQTDDYIARLFFKWATIRMLRTTGNRTQNETEVLTHLASFFLSSVDLAVSHLEHTTHLDPNPSTTQSEFEVITLKSATNMAPSLTSSTSPSYRVMREIRDRMKRQLSAGTKRESGATCVSGPYTSNGLFSVARLSEDLASSLNLKSRASSLYSASLRLSPIVS